MDLYKKVTEMKLSQIVLISVLSAEILTFAVSAVQSLFRWGGIPGDIIEVGAVDSFFVSLVIVSIVVSLIRNSEKIRFERDILRKELVERNQIEAALKESEDRYRTLFEGAAEGIAVADIQTRKIWLANTAFCEMFAFTKEEIDGRSLDDFHPAESFQYVTQEFDSLARGEKTKTEGIPCRRQDSSVFFADISAKPTIIGGRQMIVGFFSDVTERLLADEKLHQSEERFRMLLNKVSNIAVQGYAPDGTIRIWNKASEDIYGYTESEALGRNLVDLIIPPEMKDSAHQAIAHMAETGEGLPAEELSLMRKDGSRVSVYSNHTVVDISGVGKELYCMDIDLSDRKKAEAAARQSERVFQNLFNNSEIAMFRSRLDGLEVFNVNDKWLKLVGLTREEVIGKPSVDYWVDPGRRDEMVQMLQEQGRVADFEFQLKNKDSDVRDCVTSLTLYRQEGIVEGSVRDITEHKKLEDQLRQSQKLEGIGRLAGGIAHDFNNVLNAVLGFADLLHVKMDESDPLRPFVDEVIDAGKRGAAITRQILAFSRNQVLDIKPVDLNTIVRSIQMMLRRLVREDIEIDMVLCNNEVSVLADAGQIDQILINLAINAGDAMPGAGKLMISTDCFTLDDDYAEMQGYGAPGDYGLLTVSDSGIGMDKDTLSRIFEPFFTTKGIGRGTGLGLSVVHGIVKQHGGYMNVYSEVGKGSAFKIYLPLTNHKKEEVEDKPVNRATGGTETILVAEDDAASRKLSGVILKQYGYKVIEAVDGEDAVRKYVDHRGEIRLVILDGIMPRVNGREAYEAIRKINPGMRAIFLSGYTEDIFTTADISDKAAVFLHKPIRPDTLAQKVREALNG